VSSSRDPPRAGSREAEHLAIGNLKRDVVERDAIPEPFAEMLRGERRLTVRDVSVASDGLPSLLVTVALFFISAADW
jgi:hypothetical protein